jgi:hypothetical protein
MEGMGGAGDGGENSGFGKPEEVDTVRTTKAAEFGDIVGKVNVAPDAEAGAGVSAYERPG